MKKLILFLAISLFLIQGCGTQTKQNIMEKDVTGEKIIEEKITDGILVRHYDNDYYTRISADNNLAVVRKPVASDFQRRKLPSLPVYDPKNADLWQIDLRGYDLSSLDLTNRLSDLMHADFDDKTKWPEKLPNGFDPNQIKELGKDPGLGIRGLHENGITGKGVGIAIIDQPLLVDHTEYRSNLKMYEEIHIPGMSREAQMHGPAVASIAVGKSTGVAPDADLYFIAETHGTYLSGGFTWDLSWLADSIDRIVEINGSLPECNKIRVISISLGIGSGFNGWEKAMVSIKAAEKSGIYVAYVDSNPFMGAGRNSLNDPNSFNSFSPAEFLREGKSYNTGDQILIPMDSRCLASPTGNNDYVFYSEGGMSWTVPYVAGLYALACQVKPDITPDEFWKAARDTAVTANNAENPTEILGKIINPVELINSIKEN